MNSDACCTRLDPGCESPFDIVMLGWYDGRTSGLARCRACGTAYHFEMVAWDEEHELRVYGLTEVTGEAFEKVASANAQPVVAERFQERSDALTLLARDALATNVERSLYIIAGDLAKRILGSRRMDFATWTSVIGLQSK